MSKKNNRILSKSYTNLFNEKLFKLEKILSFPEDSGSNSLVYLLKGNNNYQYILKITMLKDNSKKYGNELFNDLIKKNLSFLEIEMYKIMKYLIRHKITPHLFQYVDDLVNINKKDLNKNLIKTLEKYDKNFTFITSLLNETVNYSGNLMTLRDFKDRINDSNLIDNIKISIINNVLFQILYTLEVFTRIGIKHNDLHSKNIFVILHKKNIFNKGDRLNFCRRYIYLDRSNNIKELLLPDIGIEVKIYDFDRSCKQKNNFKYYPKEISSVLLNKYSIYNQNSKPNESFDTYKILCDLALLNKKKKYNIFYHVIKRFFPKKELLTDGKIVSEIIDPVHKYKTGSNSFQNVRYYMPYRVLKNNEMFSTIKIMNILKKYFNNQCLEKKVIESYNMQYIYKPKKDALLPILKATELKFELKTKKN